MARVMPVALGLLLTALAIPPGASQSAEFDLPMHCDHNTGLVASLEEPYFVNQGCWQHHGMHHFFVGRDVVYRLHGGTGFVGGKEQFLSPKIEYSQSPPPTSQLLGSYWYLETSLDGLEWKKVPNVQFQFQNANNADVSFTVPAPGEAFRFFRIRNPMSATNGLSGYEDGNLWTLRVSVLGPAPAPALTPQTVSKGCEEDILEDVWADHPCWFGGLHYYDAPSWFHTYFLGRARLERVSGTATAAFWRAADVGQVVNGMGVEGATSPITGILRVQTSNDSVVWTDLGQKVIVYGVQDSFTFEDLDGVEAKFVRLAMERQPHWLATQCWHECSAEHHNEGYMLESHLTLTGDLP